jgi:hypothetical protein
MPESLSRSNPHYLAITEFYGEQKAHRSGLLYMNHINEGLTVLNLIGALPRVAEAFCLHPVVQHDDAMKVAFAPESVLFKYQVNFQSLALAVEYRWIANGYLSGTTISSLDEVRLSPLPEVRQMLIADKVQNRKDFEIYHFGSHPRSSHLVQYFANWLQLLGVSEDEYQNLAARLRQQSSSAPSSS